MPSFRAQETVRCLTINTMQSLIGWASRAAARGTNLEVALRRYKSNQKCGASKLEFPHAKTLSENDSHVGHAP
jgi:hypothetical protein